MFKRKTKICCTFTFHVAVQQCFHVHHFTKKVSVTCNFLSFEETKIAEFICGQKCVRHDFSQIIMFAMKKRNIFLAYFYNRPMHSGVKFDFSTHFEIRTKFQISSSSKFCMIYENMDKMVCKLFLFLTCNDYLPLNLILKFMQN